jgi:hypothetical protein
MSIGRKAGETVRQLVQLGEQPGDCWMWLGGKNRKTGYGKKQFHGKTVLAHRWVYEQLLGPIPAGLVINHKCRNRLCVNPHHLEVTDTAGNCRDGAGTTLTVPEVTEIMRLGQGRRWGDGARVARKFGVSGALIHDIWRGRAWKDISP